MTILANNEQGTISAGKYAAKISGALDLQWDINGLGFSTLTDGGFTGASDVIIDLPTCNIKVINGGANTVTLKLVRAN